MYNFDSYFLFLLSSFDNFLKNLEDENEKLFSDNEIRFIPCGIFVSKDGKLYKMISFFHSDL